MMWFKRKHHHSFFPLAIAGLTIALILFMILSFSARRQGKFFGSQNGQAVSTVSEDDYRSSLKGIVNSFSKDLANSKTDLEKLLIVESGLDDLLALTVPVTYKDLHLELALAMNQMKNGLRGEPGALAQGQVRFEQTVNQYPWLK